MCLLTHVSTQHSSSTGTATSSLPRPSRLLIKLSELNPVRICLVGSQKAPLSVDVLSWALIPTVCVLLLLFGYPEIVFLFSYGDAGCNVQINEPATNTILVCNRPNLVKPILEEYAIQYSIKLLN